MMHRHSAGLPSYDDLGWTTLEVLRERGGSATVQEILEGVADRLEISEDEQARLRADGRTSELYARLAQVRTWLKAVGAITSAKRAVWAITPHGDALRQEDVRSLQMQYLGARRQSRDGGIDAAEDARAEEPQDEVVPPDDEDTPSWKDRLLSRLRSMEPLGFERLTQRLLREAGFVDVTVTPPTRDDGFDGVGVYRPTLISFPVFFECKRYQGVVRANAIRDFRGAMDGRGEKGLFITTGTFTGDARREATRPGARPRDLIDGEELCDLLLQYELGVRATEVIREAEVDDSFFES